MEIENVEIEVAKTEETKPEITGHALGLQDLYKAAFSQESVNNFADFHDKSLIIGAHIIEESPEKYYEDAEKIKGDLEEVEATFKNENFGDAYQLYTLKGLQYSVDFAKPPTNPLELGHLNYETTKAEKFEGVEILGSATVLNRSYESFQNDAGSVLDLDKGIQIHFVKADGGAAGPAEAAAADAAADSPSLAYDYETCEYTGDAQILHRYLSDSAFLKDGSNQAIGTVTVNFASKENGNPTAKRFCDSDSVGVNPETLGVRFEDCDFNSSDSFASTESIIPKNVKCPKCPKKFMFKSDLLRHDKHKHSMKPKLFCKYCNKEFVSQQNLLFHEKSHKKKRNSYKCDTCKKVFKNSGVLVKHLMKKHWKSSPFSCSSCGKNFASQVLLNGHRRKFHVSDTEKPFKCKICPKSFEKKQGLSCHAKAHLEDHPHACHLCDKSFSKICYLKNHQKSHSTDEKNGFACDACGKDFRTSAALEEHARKHTGEKPFTCNVCMKRFAYKAYLKVHIKKHSEVKPFACSHCQKSFATGAELNKHEKSHAKEKLKCPGSKSQEVCTQTTDFGNGGLQNVTLQNVNVIVDQSFGNQQPIVLTSIGSFIDSNSMPVILTPNPGGSYSVPSIT